MNAPTVSAGCGESGLRLLGVAGVNPVSKTCQSLMSFNKNLKQFSKNPNMCLLKHSRISSFF